MAKKNSKKKPVQKEEVSVQEIKDLVVPVIDCTCTGHTFIPASSGFSGKCIGQKWVESLGMLLLYFEGGKGPYNATTCKLVEGGES